MVERSQHVDHQGGEHADEREREYGLLATGEQQEGQAAILYQYASRDQSMIRPDSLKVPPSTRSLASAHRFLAFAFHDSLNLPLQA